MKRILFAFALAAALIGTGCAGHRAPILVGQAGLATAQSIEKLSDAGKQLQQAGVLPVAAALGFQERLLQVNEKLKELPNILRTIDRLQEAGNPTAGEVDRAVAVLTVVSQDVSVVIAGVPLSEATGQLITLVRAADKTISDILVGVAQIRGREQ